ncbi:hypothetical protein [Kineococcus sp. SYSU DK001]|uniref:hypothetical protein n=1 Tax=Kineococcus sp. SYSU DK001 TaxID=3383122 RepID=UPI003D7EE719
MITPRPAPAALWCAVGAGVLLAGCGADGSPDPAPTTTTTRPTATATGSTSPASPTSSGPGFDCTTVQAAQDALDEAYSAELDALDIQRGDPRAQSVFTVVTTTEGPVYYAAVLAAAPPGSLQDAQVVLDYYTRLATQVGTLDPGTGSADDLARAMSAIDDAGVVVNPDPTAATTVVQAQERLQAAVERDCAGSTPTQTTQTPSASTPATTSPASPG